MTYRARAKRRSELRGRGGPPHVRLRIVPDSSDAYEGRVEVKRGRRWVPFTVQLSVGGVYGWHPSVALTGGALT